MRHVFTLVAMTMLAGCYSVNVVQTTALGEKSAGHVVISNYGWTLFGCLPLVCGNADTDSWCPVTLFKDEVNPVYAYEKLVALADEKKCAATDIHFQYDNRVLFDAWYAPIPWILVYRKTDISANLMRE